MAQNKLRIFIFWDHLPDISTVIAKLLIAVEIHVLSHSATWAGSLEWTLLYFLTFFFLLHCSLRWHNFFLYCRDSKAISWGHYPNIQCAARKRNIANHILATQRWAKDKKLDPAHVLARWALKSSSTKLTYFYKETWHNQRSASEIPEDLTSWVCPCQQAVAAATQATCTRLG